MPLKFRELERMLRDFGYKLDHQRGSHQTYSFCNEYITVPKHKGLKPGTAKSILQDIAKQQGIDFKAIKSDYNIKL